MGRQVCLTTPLKGVTGLSINFGSKGMQYSSANTEIYQY